MDGPPLAWPRFEKWFEVDGMMLLYIGAKKYLVLPARALAEGELAMMRGYLESAGVPKAGKSWWRPYLGLSADPS